MRLKDIAKLNSWEVAKISELTFFQEGPGVRKKQYTNEGVKLLNVGNLQEGKLDLSLTDRYISEEEAYGRYSHFLVDEGDLIIACSGIQISYFHEKMAFVKKSHLPLCMNTSTMRFKSLNPQKLDINYFSYFLKTIFFKDQLQRLITGSAQLNFGPSHIKEIDLILPPLEIQEKIVKFLDQAQALIDKRKEQIKALDQLIESIFYTMFGDPVRNEKGWAVKELEEVLLNNVSNIKKDFKDDISYIDIGSINNNNNSIETYNNFNIKNAPSRAKRILNHGDILFSTVRPNLKNIAIFDMYTENTAIGSTGFCIIRVNESLVNNKYIFNVVKNKRFTGYLVKIAEGASYPAVKDSDIKSIKISIPPLSLQNEFAQKVQIIEKQKELLEESLELLDENYKSIMDRAFKGQLFN